MSDDRNLASSKPRVRRVEVYWTTITYKTVALYLALIFGLVMVTLYLVYPDWYTATLARVSSALAGGDSPVSQLSGNQARLVNLDGRVRVKQVNSVDWVAAERGMALDKGDLIETGVDSAARLTFADGTTYTVKSDTLVTVEENSVNRDRTRVGVHISSGAVDLATGAWPSPDSKAEVSFENAVASLRQNSRAAVRSDPSRNEHEITVAAGQAEVLRGEERVDLGRFERASFPTGGPMTKSNVLAPPGLTQPVNLQPVFVTEPRRSPVRFEWSPVPGAVGYNLQVSTNSMFTKVVAERRANSTSVVIPGLDAGEYFWNVTASDEEKRVSEPSDTHKFTLVAQGKGPEMLLEITGTQLHGNVAEVIGRTEPGAALIINGQPVPNIQPDGSFRFFTEPLARGSQTIVISGQNRRGGTAIKRVPIVVPS